MKNIVNDRDYVKYLAPKPVLIVVAIIIVLALAVVAYKYYQGDVGPVPWESRNPLGL